jgi:hypothetical protein
MLFAVAATKAKGNRWTKIAQQQQVRTASSNRRMSMSVRNVNDRPGIAGEAGAPVTVKADGWGAYLHWKIFWVHDAAVPRRVGLIHHLSPFSRHWPRVVNTAALLTALLLPPVVCWGEGEWEGFLFQFLMGLVLVANSVVRQLTTVSTSRKTLQTHAEIRGWYVRTELLLDVLSAVPYGVLAVPRVITPNPRGSLELLRLLQWLCLLRIFRDGSLEQLAVILLETPRFYKWIGTLKLIAFWFLHLHLCTSLLHFCGTRYDVAPEGPTGWLALDAAALYLELNGFDQYLLCCYDILQAQTGGQLSSSTNRSELVHSPTTRAKSSLRGRFCLRLLQLWTAQWPTGQGEPEPCPLSHGIGALPTQVFGIYNNIFGAFISALLLGKLAGACANNQTKRCLGAFARSCCDFWLL